MQTFLPYGADYWKCALSLDRQRLGKQRVEAWQIYRTLVGITDGWRHHPAVKMWAGYEASLVDYGIAMCREWRSRGYKDTLLMQFNYHKEKLAPRPDWLYGDSGDDLIRSHRSNLIRKMPHYYGPIWPDVPDDLPYYWPGKVTV
jgi:hypothetical protein